MGTVPLIANRSCEKSLRMRVLTIALVLVWWLFTSVDHAQAIQELDDGKRFNIPMQTRGGQQFWTDVRNIGNWRVQRNELTSHYRVIDSAGVRRGWGSKTHCLEKLDAAIAAGQIEHRSGKVVILIHGLLRSRRSLNSIEQYLSGQGYSVINFEYASTRKEVAVHASALNEVISALGDEVTRIDFVCHSLGNIVLRHYLKDMTDPATGRQGDARISRIVMLGPPNQGSRMARLLRHSFFFGVIAGVSGGQLSSNWEQLKQNLAIPNAEFGIVAGGPQENSNGNPVLTGPDDFTVSLEEATLEGADDMFIRPLFHSTMMNQPEVHAAILSFLQEGYFTTEEERVRVPELVVPDTAIPRSDNGSDRRDSK